MTDIIFITSSSFIYDIIMYALFILVILNIDVEKIIISSHVIMILVDVAHGRQKHIPYRDSRLTFLLQV